MKEDKTWFEERVELYPASKDAVFALLQEKIKAFRFVENDVDDAEGVCSIWYRSDEIHHFRHVQEGIRSLFQDIMITHPNQTFVGELVRLMIHKKWKIAFAESLTAGYASSLIANIPDASKVLEQSFVVYSEKAKETILGLDPTLMNSEGVVNELVASAMAKGLFERTNAEVCISLTGIAGPSTDAFQTPVGTVWIGIAIEGKVTTKEFHFHGNRNRIRRQAAHTAINETLQMLLEEKL
ncbi:MAG: CinA family protein [Candidatus Izemoplasmatales bacterium]|nr:CinA family protein [Candidatus Izemoplasmatales bacterium]